MASATSAHRWNRRTRDRHDRETTAMPALDIWMTLLGLAALIGGLLGYPLAELAGYGIVAAIMLMIAGIGAIALGIAHRRLRALQAF